jgi:hypothetical protein
MDTIISEIVNLTPKLDKLDYTTKTKKKIDLIKKSLEKIEWEDLDSDITDTQVYTADVFLEVYFVRGDNIPRLRKLATKKMTDIARDEYGRVIAYIYKDTVVNEEVDYVANTATVDRDSERVVTWVFEKGKTTIIDPYDLIKDDDGEVILNDKGEPSINIKVMSHKTVFKDDFYIIHIPSIKKTDSPFSDIIASKWIDHILKSDAIASDYRFINRMSAMGLNVLVDLELLKGSSRSPGGFINTKSSNENTQGKFIRVEIDNKLATLTEEKADCALMLFRKSFLMRPDLEQSLSGSDSSRTGQILKLPLEKFIKKLLQQKIKGMKKYFEMVQKCDPSIKIVDDFEFKLPNPIIENSVFDQLLQDMQELNMGKITLRDIWKRDGLTDSEMEEKEERINAEIMNGKNDISINKQVKSIVDNANNTSEAKGSIKIDNNFKTEKAVGKKK